MPFVQAKCPNCGGVLAVDNSNEAAVCQFCNTPFIVERAINNYNITNNVNVGAGAVVNIIGSEKHDFEIIGGNLKKYVGASSEIVIPDSVVTIENNVFKDLENLKSVVIPDSVKTIGEYAFSGCISLENLTLGKNIEYIGQYAFNKCTEIKKVNFAGSIADWCKIGFDIIDSNPVEYSRHLFIKGHELTAITKEDLSDVAEIPCRRFANCCDLRKVDIPKNVINIQEQIFSGCSELEYINVESGNENYRSVNNCLIDIKKGKLISGSNNCSVPNDGSVKRICDGAFEGLSKIKSVSIPQSVTEIGVYAFRDCTALTDVKLPNSILVLKNSIFNGCISLKNIVIPDSVTEIDNWAFGNCKTLESIIIPNGVKRIGRYAFNECISLKKVVIGDGVTEICERAFTGCQNIESLILGKNVRIIGDRAFFDCRSLTNVVIPDSVVTIEEKAFFFCKSLKSVTIGTGLQRMGRAVFYDSGLTDLNIPKNVLNNIGMEPFTGNEWYGKNRNNYGNNKNKKNGGCYVATAVYGSYDCPEVWTLRRYRDYSLALTWYGRLFITLYYAISPTIVKWFGHTKWFNNLWRSKLDRMVKKLQSLGYEDTPYNDKYRE